MRFLEDYFCKNSNYSPRDFERRFLIRRQVLNSLLTALNGSKIFTRRSDGLQKKVIHPIQRITAALLMVTNGVDSDSLDEYIQMSETDIILSTNSFFEEVVKLLVEQYICEPIEEDLK